MAKRKPKPLERKRIDITLSTIYEGDVCKVVCVNCPWLSGEKLVTLGSALVQLSYLMQVVDNAQQVLDDTKEDLRKMRYGKML